MDLLTYHVASGNVQAKDVKDGEMIKTVEGKDVTARVIDGSILINSAKVLLANVDASNGVVHIIDAVLIPPGFVPPPTPRQLPAAPALPRASRRISAPRGESSGTMRAGRTGLARAKTA